jgi:murein DD-endopeptidase MepM/ murein hydrolase activator NlpD
VTALAAAPVYLFIKSTEPEAEFAPVPKAVGGTAKLKVQVKAPHGLRLLSVAVEQGAARAEGKSTEAADRWFFWKRKEAPKTVEFDLKLNQQQGFKTGPGVLVLNAESNDLRGLAVRRSHSVTVQLEPPRVSVIEDGILYMNQGGSALVKFDAGGGWTEAGVRVGPYTFRSWKRAGASSENERFSLFAFPWDAPVEAAPVVFVRDAAGNEVIATFKHKVFAKHWRRRTLELDDGFMQKAVAEINPPPGGSLLDRFLQVNREFRKQNNLALSALRQKTAGEFLWQQPFRQLTNSQVEALFADYRTYRYEGKEVDQQVHLGFDLSKTKESPVEAANRGKVVWAGRLGIYGNCVVIDHGYGLQSVYAHMSHIDVKEGQAVEAGATLGRSGATGLAGGDHLHFSMQLDGTQVNPVEWWDSKWIREHVHEPLGMAEAKQ